MTLPGMARAASASKAFAKATGGRPLPPTWRDLEVAEEIGAILSPVFRARHSTSSAEPFKDLVLLEDLLVVDEVVVDGRSETSERMSVA